MNDAILEDIGVEFRFRQSKIDREGVRCKRYFGQEAYTKSQLPESQRVM